MFKKKKIEKKGKYYSTKSKLENWKCDCVYTHNVNINFL